MINNLTASAKSLDRIRNRVTTLLGSRTALSGFFMSAAHLYLPVMVGWVGLPSGRSAFQLCAEIANPAQPSTIIPNFAIRSGGPILHNWRSLMAHSRLSVYAVFVKKAVQKIPHIGDSPRCIIDLKEISQLSKLSVDKVRIGLEELQREGYLCRMFKGRRTKQRVYAMTNPDLKGTAQEVWS